MLISYPISAQDTDEAFSNIRFGFNVTSNVSQNTFNEYWDAQYAPELFLTMPFYWGEVEVNAGFFRYDGRGEEMNFNSILGWLGWGKSVQVTNNLNLFAGFLIGNNYISFEDDGFLKKGESELTAGLYSRASYEVGKQWQVHFSASRTRIFTYHRIDMTHVSLGLSRRFDSPDWLKTFLK